MTLIIVGEAPSRTSDPSRPLSSPRTAEKLARLFGDVPFAAAEKVNLFDAYPGSAGKGTRFDAKDARERADAWRAVLRGERRGATVVLLGKRVGRAFFPWELDYLRWHEVDGVRYAIVPHPSGVVRWWNDFGNRRRAVRFCRKAGRLALAELKASKQPRRKKA